MRQPRQLPQVHIFKIHNLKKRRAGEIFRSKNKNNCKTAKSQILSTLQISLAKFGGSEPL